MKKLWLLLISLFLTLFYLAHKSDLECQAKLCSSEKMKKRLFQGQCYCVEEAK